LAVKIWHAIKTLKVSGFLNIFKIGFLYYAMRIYFKTFGCTMNKADEELMKSIVCEKHEIAGSPDECDVAVVNSCGVIKRTELDVLREVRELKRRNKKVVVAGCLPGININALKKEQIDGALSSKAISKILETIDSVEKGKRFFEVSDLKEDKAKLRLKYNSINDDLLKTTTVAPVSISEGCLSACSYCATRLARGKLRSFGTEAIKQEAEYFLKNGFKELQLTAQDTACYGMDINKSLPELINEVSSLEGVFRIRVGMLNPKFAKKILKPLINSFSSEKVYKFLHLPVQSGDDNVLKQMKRGYTAEEFSEIVHRFRSPYPDMTLSTDIIVGYPTETEEAFERTLNLVKEVEPNIINIKRFSKREKTPAAKLKDLPDGIKKERSTKLTELFKEIALRKNKKYIGKTEEVLITEFGKDDALLARMNNYQQVVIKNSNLKLGEFASVKIKEATPFYLVGEK